MTPWSCGRCDRSGEVPDHVAIVYHNCELPKRPRRVVPLPESEWITREEARSQVWAGLAAQLDAGWRYRKKKNA